MDSNRLRRPIRLRAESDCSVDLAISRSGVHEVESDRRELFEWSCRKFDLDAIAWPYNPAVYHHRHYARLPDGETLSISLDNLLEQTRLELLDLHARITQPAHFDNSLVAES